MSQKRPDVKESKEQRIPKQAVFWIPTSTDEMLTKMLHLEELGYKVQQITTCNNGGVFALCVLKYKSKVKNNKTK